MNRQRYLKSTIARLHVLVKLGKLEPRQKEAATKAIKDLARSLSARDLRRVTMAIDRLARVFLRG